MNTTSFGSRYNTTGRTGVPDNSEAKFGYGDAFGCERPVRSFFPGCELGRVRSLYVAEPQSTLLISAPFPSAINAEALEPQKDIPSAALVTSDCVLTLSEPAKASETIVFVRPLGSK